MPLKGIPNCLSPELLHVLASAGHGDEVVIADAHFPTSSICKCGPREVRADGLKSPELLKAILQLYPLDQYVEEPVALMDIVPSDKERGLQVPIWQEYHKIVDTFENNPVKFEQVERFAFYDRARSAFAVIHTGETSQYANIILKKGVCLN